MKLFLKTEEFYLLQNFLDSKCGIYLEAEESYIIEDRLADLAFELQCKSYTEFYYKLCQNQDTQLLNLIIDIMTPNDTSWFRDKWPFKLLNTLILPELIQNNSQVAIWSAGCSTGQEAYSILITILEHLQNHSQKMQFLDNLSILATDISSANITIAQSGYYNAMMMDYGIEDELRKKYFLRRNRLYCFKDEFKKYLSYQCLNLLNSEKNEQKFDIIFLRNVIMSYANKHQQQLLDKIIKQLKPNGYLILGATEFCYNIDEFESSTFEDHILYRLKTST